MDVTDPQARPAILLSTCDRYVPMAEANLRVLERLWPGHPPVFVCGSSTPVGTNSLGLRSDSADWVGITRDAADDLLNQGYRFCYLVLDDHIPFGACNVDVLNTQMPSVADRLGAVNVNLCGWDQYQDREGAVMGADCLHWMRNSETYRWKFSLHPALWNLERFRSVLARVADFNRRATSARDFEAITGASSWAPAPEWLKATYRVCGDRYGVGERWYQVRWKRRGLRKSIDALRLGARVLGGRRLLEKLDSRLMLYMDYMHGPYPLYWSGLLRQGVPAQAPLRFLSLTNQQDSLRDVTGVLSCFSERKGTP